MKRQTSLPLKMKRSVWQCAVGTLHARRGLHVHSTLNVHEVNASLKKSRLGVIFSGGAEESRTPVRKLFAAAFYECSNCFKIPSEKRPEAGYFPWQPLVCGKIKGVLLLTFTASRRPDTRRGTQVQDGCLIKQQEQLYCCRLFFKLRILQRSRTATRLPRFTTPVETFTPPNIN